MKVFHKSKQKQKKKTDIFLFFLISQVLIVTLEICLLGPPSIGNHCLKQSKMYT